MVRRWGLGGAAAEWMALFRPRCRRRDTQVRGLSEARCRLTLLVGGSAGGVRSSWDQTSCQRGGLLHWADRPGVYVVSAEWVSTLLAAIKASLRWLRWVTPAQQGLPRQQGGAGAECFARCLGAFVRCRCANCQDDCLCRHPLHWHAPMRPAAGSIGRCTTHALQRAGTLAGADTVAHIF